jgi:hypothetical protein
MIQIITKEIELDPEYYPSGISTKEMAEIELGLAKDDPFGFFMDVDSEEIKYEIIEDEEATPVDD